MVPEPETSAETNAAVASSAGAISEKTSAWLEKAGREDVDIVSGDGFRLVGDIFPAPEDSRRWVIAVQGYTGRRQHMYACGAGTPTPQRNNESAIVCKYSKTTTALTKTGY